MSLFLNRPCGTLTGMKPLYYKIQYYDTTSICWRDIQKSYATTELAHAAAVTEVPGLQYRLMCVDGKKRHIVA